MLATIRVHFFGFLEITKHKHVPKRNHLTSGRPYANRFFCSMNESTFFAQQIQSIVNVRFLQQG